GQPLAVRLVLFRVQLKDSGTQKQQNPEHQPLLFHIGRFVGSKWESKRFTGWACPVFSDSEEGIISGLFGFKVSWGLVVKTGMESGAVVEGFDVIEDGATRFG